MRSAHVASSVRSVHKVRKQRRLTKQLGQRKEKDKDKDKDKDKEEEEKKKRTGLSGTRVGRNKGHAEKENGKQEKKKKKRRKIDEPGFVGQYNSSHLLMKKLYLCLTVMTRLLGVVPHSSSLVTMAVPMPHWDVTSDYISQERNRPVWITFRDFLHPPDMLAMRTAGPF